YVASDLPAQCAQQSKPALHRSFASVDEHECASPVGTFDITDVETGLPVERGMLIACDARDRNTVRQTRHVDGLCDRTCAGNDSRQHRLRHPEELTHTLIPGAPFEVH